MVIIQKNILVHSVFVVMLRSVIFTQIKNGHVKINVSYSNLFEVYLKMALLHAYFTLEGVCKKIICVAWPFYLLVRNSSLFLLLFFFFFNWN